MKRTKFDEKYYFGEVYDNYDQFLDFKKLAKDLIANYNFKSFLDVGCGCGNFVKEIKKQLEEKYKKICDVQGIDISEFAVKRANVPFVYLANCTSLPFKDNRFDLVYILVVFSYLKTKQEIKAAMREAYRVSGAKIVFEDVYNVPHKSSDDYDPHRMQFLNQKAWYNLWKETLNKSDKIKLNGEEIVISKKYEL